MATIRRASAYSKKHVVPYTRVSKLKGRSYIKTVPPQKIVKFKTGKEGVYPHKLIVIALERAQLRDSALEACRQYITKKLDIAFPTQYFFNVVPFPHHIQRENKMLSMAGADRLSTGMQLSFGRAISKAAIVDKGSPVFRFELPNPKSVEFARELISQIRSKIPVKIRVLYEERK
jgi:large subunit ribosomal protein L10e